MAKFIATYDIAKHKYTLVDMLAYGHRGYISYSEDELCKAFDAIYAHMLEKVQSLEKDLKEKSKDAAHRPWHVSDAQRTLDSAIAEMVDANDIASDIFERQFLG